MNIIDIYKTKIEDIQLVNHEGRDVYTCVYIDNNNQKKEFQCFGNSEKFLNALEDYQKHLKKIELKINKDIINYFAQVKKKKNIMAIPFYIIGGIALLLSFAKPPEIIGIPLFFGGCCFVVGTLMIANADIEMTEDNIKKYVPDQNVIKAKEGIDKKLQFVKSLNKKYSQQIASSFQQQKVEMENFKNARKELDAKQKQNILKEEDFLEYTKLSKQEKLQLKKRAMSIKNIQDYKPFKPDVPVFLAASIERDNIRKRNFLEFALADNSLNLEENKVNLRDVNIPKLRELDGASIKRIHNYNNLKYENIRRR